MAYIKSLGFLNYYDKNDIQNSYNWWCALSINEQKSYTNLHPFYGKMNSIYVVQVKHGIPELYLYLKENKLNILGGD